MSHHIIDTSKEILENRINCKCFTYSDIQSHFNVVNGVIIIMIVSTKHTYLLSTNRYTYN